MAITGVTELIYGVDDLAPATKFFADFGLPLVEQTDELTRFELREGSSVELRLAGDPALPLSVLRGNGPRLVVWGVDSVAALEDIASALRSAGRPAQLLPDGTLRVADPAGIPIGFRATQRKPVVLDPGQVNAPGAIARWNQHRKWYRRAQPAVLAHVVFSVPDIDAALDFYVRTLSFRVSDISRGLGVFLRADGRSDHHNLFFMKDEQGGVAFHHASFEVENIDEAMVGANYMQRRGWSSAFGIGRHRLSSAVFYFMSNPAGGQAEYLADSDHLTDEWKPRIWDPKFGTFQWANQLHPLLAQEPEWNVRVLEEPLPSFSELVGERFEDMLSDAAVEVS